MDKSVGQYFEKEILTPKQQRVVDYYSENPYTTRIECCKEIYGDANPFHLQDLSAIETQIRKKGYLFYVSNGKVIDMARKDVDVELKLKVQKRIGGIFFGYLRSNAQIFSAATDKKQKEFASIQWKNSLQKLIDEGYIFKSGVNWNKLLLKDNKTKLL